MCYIMFLFPAEKSPWRAFWTSAGEGGISPTLWRAGHAGEYREHTEAVQAKKSTENTL